ncbi:MAG: MmcQ/YjbR family DNA-binding protein [Flavobacteriaceae bacterium]|jgi:predicted DNA-binding protein (MmcQ/YjbR family)|nr:MmcQ/YjbR family DNA-binding protein [Flavobacteriaceae bacterium]
MNIEEFREFCLSLPAVTECFPFDDETLVFKVLGKMFALTGLNSEIFSVSLKCNPDYALELREKYPEIIVAGHHLNKKHWNTVNFEKNLFDNFLIKLIQHSYDEVVKKMTRIQKAELLKFG